MTSLRGKLMTSLSGHRNRRDSRTENQTFDKIRQETEKGKKKMKNEEGREKNSKLRNVRSEDNRKMFFCFERWICGGLLRE